MSKQNREKRDLSEERHQGIGEPNPILYSPAPLDTWGILAPILTLPGKPPHRICRGKP